MSKQTALQWFKEMVELNHGHVPHDIYKQALQMEREQIEIAYWIGGQDIPYSAKQCEQYYNETYGNHNGDVNKMVGGQDE